MTTKKHPGWDKRNVRYEEVHNVSDEYLAVLAGALRLVEGNVFTDIMCGYGAVTKAVLDYHTSRGIRTKPILVDFSREQLDRSRIELPDSSIPRLCEDARSLSLTEKSVDGVVIKMGVHEVPRKDQYKIIENAYNALKPGGAIALWDLMFETKLEQLVFQTIIREKDRLAGFDGLALNRYLPREDELRDYLHKAGFEAIELLQEIPYHFSSEKRLHAEFGGDEYKLAEWNEFIRAVVPDDVKEAIQYKDTGKTIEAVFRKGILRAIKPQQYSKIGMTEE